MMSTNIKNVYICVLSVLVHAVTEVVASIACQIAQLTLVSSDTHCTGVTLPWR